MFEEECQERSATGECQLEGKGGGVYKEAIRSAMLFGLETVALMKRQEA